jgi:hypothetical protein
VGGGLQRLNQVRAGQEHFYSGPVLALRAQPKALLSGEDLGIGTPAGAQELTALAAANETEAASRGASSVLFCVPQALDLVKDRLLTSFRHAQTYQNWLSMGPAAQGEAV